jgi:hypothetical protein
MSLAREAIGQENIEIKEFNEDEYGFSDARDALFHGEHTVISDRQEILALGGDGHRDVVALSCCHCHCHCSVVMVLASIILAFLRPSHPRHLHLVLVVAVCCGALLSSPSP